MAADKWIMRLEAKLDALLEKNGLKPADFADVTPAPRAPRELTAAEQQARANAPVVPAATPSANAPRTTAQNAPSTASSVPPSPPFAGYDDLNVAETLDMLKDRKSDKALIASALAYERANKNRSSLIETYVNWNS